MISYASPALISRKEGFVGHMQEFKGNRQGFMNYSGNPAGTRDTYQPMGSFDNIRLKTGNNSSWRYTHPNEPLMGNYPKFELGPNNLFMFKDNQAKPECCGASYATDTGCLCVTDEQRAMINTRGGNRSNIDSDPGI